MAYLVVADIRGLKFENILVVKSGTALSLGSGIIPLTVALELQHLFYRVYIEEQLPALSSGFVIVLFDSCNCLYSGISKVWTYVQFKEVGCCKAVMVSVRVDGSSSVSRKQ
jgi:hypothetical protein